MVPATKAPMMSQKCQLIHGEIVTVPTRDPEMLNSIEDSTTPMTFVSPIKNTFMEDGVEVSIDGDISSALPVDKNIGNVGEKVAETGSFEKLSLERTEQAIL